MLGPINLDTDAPDKVAPILREAASRFDESCADLAANWGDPAAGRVWGDIARILERAADSVDKALVRRGL